MKQKYSLYALLVFLGMSAEAQKFITKEGTIEIFSETPLFTIEATNRKVASILNGENGEVVASTLARSFKFREALVEEHYNENYMESHLYPKAVFKGKIIDFNKLELKEDGNHKITLEGELTLHGQTNPLNTTGEIFVKDGKISAFTEFSISLEQYGIEVEHQYKDRIKDDIRLKISFEYKPM